MRTLRAATFLFVALLAQSGLAQSNTRADQLFAEARQLMKVQNYKDALPKFEESLKLDPAPGTLFNLAECEAHEGRLVSSKEHFQLAAAGFPKTDQRRAYSLGRVTELEGRVAHVTLRLSPNAPTGTTVMRGKVLLTEADFGVLVPTDPGEVSIVVTAPGHQDRKTAFTVKEGESVEYNLDVGGAIAEKPSTSPKTNLYSAESDHPRASGSPLRTVGFVVGGVGVAGLALGAVTGILTMGSASTVKDHCDASNGCDPTGLDAASSGKVTSPIATVAFIAGGVLFASGVVLILVGSKKEAPHAAFAPVVTPFGAHASLYGTF